MPRTSTYNLWNRILNGELETLLIEWKAEGVTFDEQSTRLRERGVDASRETVRRWAAELAEPDTAAS